MKYLEELTGGDCFEYSEKYYIRSSDFKSNGDIMSIGLSDGFPKWFQSNTIVSLVELLTTDSEKNIVAIKERKKQNDIN